MFPYIIEFTRRGDHVPEKIIRAVSNDPTLSIAPISHLLDAFERGQTLIFDWVEYHRDTHRMEIHGLSSWGRQVPVIIPPIDLEADQASYVRCAVTSVWSPPRLMELAISHGIQLSMEDACDFFDAHREAIESTVVEAADSAIVALLQSRHVPT